MSTKVITGEVRFSYAHVWEPKAIKEGDEPKFSVSILISKDDTVTIDAVKAAIAAAKEIGKLKSWSGKIPPNLKNPLRDGDVEKPDNEEYENCFFVNANSKDAPGIVGPNKVVIPKHESDRFYSGCYGYASVNFFAYNHGGNKGVGCGLNNLMKTRDGESLGEAKSTAAEDFGAPEIDDFKETANTADSMM